MAERDDDGAIRDLRSLVVPAAGGLVETGDRWEPYYLSDPAGGRVEPVSEFLRDLQAAGRPATTQRSYSPAAGSPAPAVSGVFSNSLQASRQASRLTFATPSPDSITTTPPDSSPPSCTRPENVREPRPTLASPARVEHARRDVAILIIIDNYANDASTFGAHQTN